MVYVEQAIELAKEDENINNTGEKGIQSLWLLQELTKALSTVLMTSVPPNVNHDKIEIVQSATGGLGVRLKENEVLHAGDVVTRYGGEPRWVTREELFDIETKGNNVYLYSFGPFFFDHTNHYVLWDARARARQDLDVAACGHLFNTAHPCLSGTWQKANMTFGIYSNDLALRRDLQPKIDLYILTLQEVRGDGLAELLLDYHWQLTQQFGHWCGDFDCQNCLFSLSMFIRSWRHHNRSRRFDDK